ncbi:hypothetical protein JCM19298_2159 [Nonlabens ulvanivorans]|nr:hypothetical protein [Nonlabens ulvanivorans]GAK93440.1 hypothetical protein JCM19298_2159 [Nonlabens ulvanivorans]
MRPQTIQLFLPDGLPTSIREAELTNRLVKAICFLEIRCKKYKVVDFSQYTFFN